MHLTCDARVLDEVDDDLGSRISSEMTRKYAAFQTAPKKMAASTRKHYSAASGSMIELIPHERKLTWDNRLLGLG